MSMDTGDARIKGSDVISDGRRLEVLRAVLTLGVEFPVVLQYQGGWVVFSDPKNGVAATDEAEARQLASQLTQSPAPLAF